MDEHAGVMLGVAALWWVLVAADGPAALRLPLTLVMTMVVPGAAVLGLLRLRWSVTTVGLTIGLSLALSALLSEALGLADLLSRRVGATALLAIVGPLLLWQVVRGRVATEHSPA
jgi:hypothetical protein